MPTPTTATATTVNAANVIVRAVAWLALAAFAVPAMSQDPQPATPATPDAAAALAPDATATPAEATPPADAATPAPTGASLSSSRCWSLATSSLRLTLRVVVRGSGASIVGTPAGTEAAPATGEAPAAGEPPADTRALDETVQDLKKDVVDLNKELFVLEEELLFPANTQVAVFVSMDIGEFFALDSLTLKIDNKEVANYLYTPREAEALLKGGVHRVYLGNLKVGEHQLVALFEGKGPNERDYKRGANLKFEKGVGAKYLELKITDRQRKGQPEFAIKDWE